MIDIALTREFSLVVGAMSGMDRIFRWSTALAVLGVKGQPAVDELKASTMSSPPYFRDYSSLLRHIPSRLTFAIDQACQSFVGQVLSQVRQLVSSSEVNVLEE
jgi:hypothetical protein